MSEQRRKIDEVLSPEFVEDLDSIELDELRRRRRACDEVENELSYYRRLLHGRMDLLSFELRRRRGEETRSLIEALPEILAAGEDMRPATPTGRAMHLTVPQMPERGRRFVDRALDSDFLTRISLTELDELQEIQLWLVEVEGAISEQRQAAQQAFDSVQRELTRRYREGLANFDELLGRH